ncbi:MAG: DUF2232 domain-containing protein [Gammaproteobacteria bacterium]|nr:DUF2232 domain-containing protein [Gammaproteobacteria bacterium]
MRGQHQAITTVVVLAMLAWALSPITWPLSYFSAAGIGLVVLVHGVGEGAKTVLGATLLVGAISFIAIGTPVPAFVLAVMIWLPAWLIAVLLYWNRSLVLTLQSIMLLGVGVVAVVYLLHGDPAGWWYQYLKEILQQMEQAGYTVALGEADVDTVLKQSSMVFTGMLVAMGCWSMVAGLLIARWWQSLLYKPGAFAEEFRNLRFGRVVALAVTLLMLLVALSSGAAREPAVNLLLVTFGILMLQGLAIVHALAARFRLHNTWLVLFYVLLLFVEPLMMSLVVFVSLADNWLDIRNRVQAQR